MRINPFLILTLVLTITACETKDDDGDSGSWEATGSDDDGSGGSGDTDGGTADGGTDGGGTEGGIDSNDPMTAALYGSIIDEAGVAIGEADIKLCTPLQCKTTTPDASGNFEFVNIEGALFALEIKGETENSAVILTFIDLAMEETRTIDTPIVIPTYRSSGTLGSTTTIAVDGGLNVSADANYTLPFGTGMEDKLSGVKMDPATAGLPVEGLGGEVVGLWYLGTWNTEVDPAWSFSIDTLEGVSAGDSLKVVTGDYLGNTWVQEGTATVGADGSVTSDGDTGLSFLSTLLFIKE